jgi:hypothetical protein
MSNFQEFIENVKAGKIEGLAYQEEACAYRAGVTQYEMLLFWQSRVVLAGSNAINESDSAALEKFIREWLSDNEHMWHVEPQFLYVDYEAIGDHEREFWGSDLDNHIDCANWVCKQGVEG